MKSVSVGLCVVSSMCVCAVLQTVADFVDLLVDGSTEGWGGDSRFEFVEWVADLMWGGVRV